MPNDLPLETLQTDFDPTEKLAGIAPIIAGEITAAMIAPGSIYVDKITEGAITASQLDLSGQGSSVLEDNRVELYVKVTNVSDDHLDAEANVQRSVTLSAVPCDGDGPNMVLGIPGVPMIHMQLHVREPSLLPHFLRDKRFKLILVPEDAPVEPIKIRNEDGSPVR